MHACRSTLEDPTDPAGSLPLKGWFAPRIGIDLEAAQARESLRHLAVEMARRYDVNATVEVTIGEPLESLVLASERADLLVLGECGRIRLTALFAGRTVDRLLRTCRRPVLVAKTPVEGPYRRVLVPIDFAPPSDAAVKVAARLARGSGLHVFHAINSHREAVLRETSVSEKVIREVRLRLEAGTIARMRRKAARLGLDGTRLGFAVAHGHPVWSTLNHARRLGADLIVVGKAGRSSLGELLLGSVSRHLLAATRCDMLIVPQTRTERVAPATLPQLQLGEATSPAGAGALVRDAASFDRGRALSRRMA